MRLPRLLLVTLLLTVASAQSTYTQRHLAPNSNRLLWSFANGGGSMVAVGQPSIILNSTDGTTWKPRSSGTHE